MVTLPSAALEVALRLTPKIVEGLATGKYKRFGGVIREAATGRIVVMLREAGSSGILPGSLTNTIINVLSLGASAGSAKLTSDGFFSVDQRLDGIGQQLGGITQSLKLPMMIDPVTGVLNLVMSGVNTGVSIKGFSDVNHKLNGVGEQLGFIGQNLQQVEGLVRLSSAGSILNLGVSVVGFSVIAHCLGELEQRLQRSQELLNKVNRKIDLSFYANFRAALDLAANAFSMSKVENRRSSALAAINRFLEAEHIYTDFVDQELEQKSQITDEYLLTLCLAYLAEARCYLELEEFDTAIRRFQEGSQKIRTRIQKYVELLLTSNPAAYLHPQFKGQIDLQRLTKIYQWIDSSTNENSVFELLRASLYNLKKDQGQESGYGWVTTLPPAIVDKSEVKGSILGNKAETNQEAMRRLPEVLQTMESMIETSYRFEAYQAEVKAISQLGVTFHGWMQLKPKEPLPEGSNLMYIIPAEPLSL
ncbi:MAG: hypothetical protein IGS48_17095 [Oscillatoriales cyanobacterium C42_A2020_001]|nr:hypothetical protein [Leptolyngbyaceae cyanobacterium C42_A2020_001]